MDERFLAIDVFVIGQRGEHDRRVAVVGRGDDDRVELVAEFRESLAVIAAGEGTRMVDGGLGEGVGIDIAETANFDGGMLGNLRAVSLTDGSHDADREHAEFGIRGDGPSGRLGAEDGGKPDSCGTRGPHETAAVDGMHIGIHT